MTDKKRLALLLILPIFSVDAFAEHRITAWPDNRKGAVSLTFDDGCKSQLSLGLPALEEKGVKGTFFLVSDSVTAWDRWQNAAKSGHEIGSHTRTHPHLTKLPVSRIREEMAGAKAVIEARIPSQRCFSFAYPFGDLDRSVESIARDIYGASRGGGINCGLNSESTGISNVRGCSPDDGNDIYGFTDAAERQGKWLVVIFHSLDGGKDCYGSWEFATWKAYLDYLGIKDLWVGTFGGAVKYIRERLSATLSVLQGSPDEIVLSLTDSLDDVYYGEPLTIRSEVPPGWVTVAVRQGSRITESRSIMEGENRVIYYKAVPDRGLIYLRDLHAE